MRVTEDTKRVAQNVVDYILEHPEQHDQRLVWAKPDPDGWGNIKDVEYADAKISMETGDMCGTTPCIAGTAIFLENGAYELYDTITEGQNDHWQEIAGDLLGLDYTESHMLFFNMDNQTAFNATLALANGDADKFHAVLYEE